MHIENSHMHYVQTKLNFGRPIAFESATLSANSLMLEFHACLNNMPETVMSSSVVC